MKFRDTIEKIRHCI